MCEYLGVDAIFAPSAETLGIGNSDDITAVVPPISLTSGLCGAFRPGHFQGVATIVTRLFNIIAPTIAYFGEKDAQQLAIIRQLVRDLNLAIEIRACATVRETSGLAVSSRNQYLSATEREKATIIAQSLQLALESFRLGERQREKLLAIVQKNLDRVAERIAEVRIVPKCDCYVIEVIYEKTEQFLAPNEKIAAIDLGIDNFMAVTSNQPDFIPLLINGRPLKSLNQFYNQRRAKLQSLLNRQSSQRIRRLTRCRNQKVVWRYFSSALTTDTTDRCDG